MLGRHGKTRIAVDAFWLSHIRSATLIVGASQTSVFFPVLVGGGLTKTFTWLESGPFPLLLIVAVYLPPVFWALWIMGRLEKRWASMELPVRLAQLLDPIQSESGPSIDGEDGFLPALDHALRKKLIAIVGLLDNSANRLDAQQPVGFTPHPISTLLRGASVQLREFLVGPNYGAQLSSRLDEILRLILVIFSEPKDAAQYDKLASLVEAFDEQGTPSIELPVKPPGKLSRLFSRATASAQGTLAIMGGLIASLVPLLAIALVLLGKIDIEKLVELLK
ncbi:hypothetical protein [Nonomuraea rhodomycinica]|uniref:Uncharacterized protein n=1 Tax=Nonomuraea rhodomycinica TaxID=1712872 RepID=A0A7Y6IKZ5_9ACTN|nr:hypothetical protein [Nonomuraea rhodomycinica]NUW40192.1 hypothetical protein [Nonomuraea rhodomycinica]